MTIKTPTGRFPARKMALSLAVALASQAVPTLAQNDESSATALEAVSYTHLTLPTILRV